MNKTITEVTTPGGIPGKNPGNPPSSEAGPKDSGGGQPLPTKNAIYKLNSPSSGAKTPDSNLELRLPNSAIDRQRSASFSDVLPLIGNNNNNNLSNVSSLHEGTASVACATESSKESQEGWTNVSSKKRPRNSPDTISRGLKQTRLSNYWLSAPVQTSNNFAALDIESDKHQESTESPTVKPPKPPPIYVGNVSNIQPLTNLLKNTVRDEYEIKVLRENEVKIQPKSTQAYTIIVKELQKRDTEFHTYRLKHERSFRVVLKNIHPSTDIEELKLSIEELGHQVTNIWNVKDRKTKWPIPLHFVDLKPSPDNKNIYNTQFLLNCRVIFEPPRAKRQIPQCATCQRYGHTKGSCFRKPRCVKCAGNHATASCLRKERSADVKCVLCNGNHPANYKGCVVYKELQKANFPPLRQRRTPLPHSIPLAPTSHDKDTGEIAILCNSDSNTLPALDSESNLQNLFKDLKELVQTITNQMTTFINMIADIMTKLTKTR